MILGSASFPAYSQRSRVLLNTATAFATWSVEYFIIHKYCRRIYSGCQTKDPWQKTDGQISRTEM